MPQSQPTGLWECVADYAGAVPFCGSPPPTTSRFVAYDVYMLQGDAYTRVGTVAVTARQREDRPYYAQTGLVADGSHLLRGRQDAAGSLGHAVGAVQRPRPAGPAGAEPRPPTPVIGCQITYSAVDWGTGFSASVRVANTGAATVTGWTLRFAFSGDQRVTTAWSTVWGPVAAVGLVHQRRLEPGHHAQAVGRVRLQRLLQRRRQARRLHAQRRPCAVAYLA